ncbi:hypothetical protein AB0A69_05330 [Streptomyces sp. NPDC045431]|uniref:hypothetical protein n=1 Tax=Streptomyces sp. NPDC045431 TaxID=3155613 RepID=UPI0033C3F36F
MRPDHLPSARRCTNRFAPSTRRVERTVCWSLAAAMLLTATEALATPTPAWWPWVWHNAWTAHVITLLCWIVLRALEKAESSNADGEPARCDALPCGDESPDENFDQAA